jgi:hypothetical protein
MSNILFSKKFLTKLTAIIRHFWWVGVRDDQTTKSLCLRAWADICIDKKIGGLGVRNLQAINQGLILSAAWRLAKEPHSQLAQILKAKYHHDTSIWRAKSNKPKSAFWAAILKVKPLLISASICQIVDGSSSVWSSPWFTCWENIYDHLIIQQHPFNYPAVVKDLWMPNRKAWNIDLISSLFNSETANAIIRTPIINSAGQDTLVWKLTPAGNHSLKSAYKHCFNNLHLPARHRPKIVPQQIMDLLNQVWKDKLMAPRVQTFAWRLLRKALPTGKRASRLSKHIKENCSRCGAIEDEMHLLILCPFSKAAWFSHPWYIKTEHLAAAQPSIPGMIQSLLSSGHPHINLSNLYTYLWCLWKARNDVLFDRKNCRPPQVYAVANAIIQGAKLEATSTEERQKLLMVDNQLQISPPNLEQHNSDLFAGNVIFSDAAWRVESHRATGKTGIGVVIQLQGNQHCQQLHVSALAPLASSPLQAEAYGLHLAAILADLMHIKDPYFYTDSSVLASAASATDIFLAPGHWEVRPLLAQIQSCPSFQHSRISHIHRSRNVKAHHQARLALKIQSTTVAIRCLSSGVGQCLSRDILNVSSVYPYTLLSVKCI